MANRFVNIMLVVLVVFCGAVGFYSFTLNRQVDRLDERITAFEDAQTALVVAVSDNLSALRASTESGLASLDTKVSAARNDITAMKSDMSAARDSLAGVTDNITAISSQVTGLGTRVAGAEAGLSRLSNSVIDYVSIYQKAVTATVRITDGQGLGSGFIYDKSGRVVTNYHVVRELSPIYVEMYDGRISKASVIGYCAFSDVAVLKMDNNPSIEPLPVADSGKIKIGESVIAIGSPFSHRDTVTEGVISQVNRFENIEGLYIANLLQFDAAINPGNSGGPLLDSHGNVIGIVVARIDANTGDGIYWAIASNKVKRVAEAIISKGSFDYPWIGTGISDLTPKLVTDKSLETANGALIGNIVSGGPAQTAGLQTGDIITAMDGISMRNIADLTSYLGEFKSPGDVTVIEVIRGTGKLKIPVTVGRRSP